MTTKSNITLSLSLILSIGLFTTPLYAVEKEHSKASTPTDKWAWLKGTIWTVPANYVLAYELDYERPATTTPKLIALNDQTVYTINGYNKGFVWGTTVLAKQPAEGGDITYSCGSLLGSITPEGSLLFGITVPPGIQVAWFPGNMIKVRNEWTMQNLKVGSYTHWAYMVQSKPTDPSYHNLPFVHLSVQEMLDKCPNYTPIAPQLD